MIVGFGDQATEDLFHGDNTKAARRIPAAVWTVACRKLDLLNAAHELRDLAVPPGNRRLRINDQFRVVFRWQDGNAHDARVADYH